MSSERSLERITDQIHSLVPDDSQITLIEFEGPEVAIYSKNIEVLMDSKRLIPKIAKTIRKRVVVRSDPDIRLPKEKVAAQIEETIG